MHANKVRPYVTRILEEQRSRGTIDRIPEFSVSKTQDHDDHPTKPSAFQVEVKGFMRDPNAYDVDAQDLRDSLNARVPSAVFFIVKPF